MLHIGTLNIHKWSNRLDQCTLVDLTLILKQSKLDVIGLQETDEKPLPKLVKQLDGYNYIYHNKTAILSKYPIRKYTYKNAKERFVSGMIILPHKYQPIFVTCVHLDYKREPTRIKQFRSIMTNINNQITKHPGIIMGDFNSLTRDDYVQKKWNDIIKVRKYAKWEYPVSELTTIITSDNNLELTTIITSDNNLELTDIRKIASNILGPLGTCRFNTRIDYIYVNKMFTQLWETCQIIHTETMPIATDHNLVSGMFKISRGGL